MFGPTPNVGASTEGIDRGQHGLTNRSQRGRIFPVRDLSRHRNPDVDWAAGPWHPWIEVTPDRVFILRYPPDHTYEDTVGAFDAVLRLSEAARSDYAFIFDFAQMTHSNAKGRAYAAECEKKTNAMASVRSHCRGVAAVIHSPLHRGIVTAVSWFVQRPYAYQVCANFDEADSWIAKRMGIPCVLCTRAAS